MSEENPIPEGVAAKYARYLANAEEAEKKASQLKDGTAREAWETIAKSYRSLAALLARRNGNL